MKKAKEIKKLTKTLDEIGFKNTTQENMTKLKDALDNNGIDIIEEISHFLSQIAHETGNGRWLTELGSDAKYKGAGYIQLTHEYNYKSFAESMGDPEIYNQGANYVAEHYAWEAAGWFWTNNKINEKIATGASVESVTRIINGPKMNGLDERKNYYATIYSILNR